MRTQHRAVIEVDRPEQIDELVRLAANAEIGLTVQTVQHVTVVIDPHDSDGVYVFEESEDAERFMAARGNEDAYTSDEPVFAGEGAAELLHAAEQSDR